jgi:Transcriptional regulator containing an amidase domain and an AraC-type DNA-binding HTH domain
MAKVIFNGITAGISVDRRIRKSTFDMPALHFHNEYEMYYLFDGTRRYIIEEQTYDLSKGSLILINKQQVHRTLSHLDPCHDRLLIEFNEEPMFSLLKQLFHISLIDFFEKNQGVFHFTQNDQSYIERLFQDIEEELSSKQTGYEKLIMLRIAELIFHINRSNDSRKVKSISPSATLPKKFQLVQEVREYIATPEGKFTSLEELALKFFVDKSYLSRIYKESIGLTVHESINIKRIKYAQELIANTEHSLQKIALKSGFQSLTYFERVFRKHTDTSPLKYRKRIRLIAESIRDNT